MDLLAGLTEQARKLALDRFRLIQPHLEQDQSLQSAADAAGVPYRTAQRWVAQYRLFGLAALARKRRQDRGERRVVSAKLKEVIEGLALQKPPLPLAALFRQVQRLSKELGEKAPSYGTVFSIVRDLGADLVTLAHEGTKAYSNTFELVHWREAAGPNAIWQADHTPLDILLIRPDGETAEPWLSTVIDDYSRAGGWVFSLVPRPLRVAHISGVASGNLAQRGFALGRVWHPRGALHGQWQRLHIQSFGTSRRGSEDPAGLFHSWQATRSWPHRTVFLDRERDVSVRVGRLCSGGRLGAWEANTDAGRVRHAVPRLLAGRVPPPRKCGNENATVRTLGGQWFPATDAGVAGTTRSAADSGSPGAAGAGRWNSFPKSPLHLATLAAYVGETVTLRFDPRDVAEIRVFHEDVFLCRAVCAELAGETVPLREILRARNRRRRELRGVLRDRESAVNTLLDLKRGGITEKVHAQQESGSAEAPEKPPPAVPRLKRYRNE